MFDWNRKLKRLDKPVDKSEWFMTPPTVNAYYDPSMNQIVFPAAILQPPFFDPNADDAVNYGGIGAVIGHEISHGFDDQGSKYTGKGVFKNWWTKKDRANFDARTAALVKQVDAYEPLPGLHLIGKNTLGENIADLAGLTIALKAYHLSLGGKPAPGDRRLYRQPAPVSLLRSDLAHEAAQKRAPAAGSCQSAQPARIPRDQRHAQHRRLVRGVRRETGRQILLTPGSAHSTLVTIPPRPSAEAYFKSRLNSLIAFERPTFRRSCSETVVVASNHSAASLIFSNG